MGRLDILLAASAISVALLAAASGAVAAADDGDSAASASPSSSDSDSGADQSADHTDANTYGSDENDTTAGDQPGDVGQNDTEGAEESGDEQGGEKNPVDDDSGSDYGRDGKTINRMPVLIPEAPPPVDLAPFPEELPPLPLGPVPPPIDLPPAVPGEPDPVDVTPLGPSAAPPDGNAPPILTFPVVVARAPVPAPAPPRRILDASLAPRATSGGQAVTSTPRWAGEPAPPLRRASTSDPLLREPPPSTVGSSARGQTSIQTGYNSMNLPRGRLSDMAAGALPGVAGMVIMTAGGICLGYRQAMAGQLLRPQGSDRFLA